jgi:hypothetical protein
LGGRSAVAGAIPRPPTPGASLIYRRAETNNARSPDLGEERVKNLIDSLTSLAKQRFHMALKIALSEAVGKPKLSTDAMSFFRRRTELSTFFLQLFDEVAKQRHRMAFEKMQSMAWH